jgi:hypothetical protein
METRRREEIAGVLVNTDKTIREGLAGEKTGYEVEILKTLTYPPENNSLLWLQSKKERVDKRVRVRVRSSQYGRRVT